MKYIIVLVYSLLSFLMTYSQKNYSKQFEKRSDSVISDRMIQKMKLLFPVTDSQKVALQKAVVNFNLKRQETIQQYRIVAEAFQQKLSKEDTRQDSIYQSILGKENYLLYKESERKEHEQRIKAINERFRPLMQQDSTKIKSNNYEK